MPAERPQDGRMKKDPGILEPRSQAEAAYILGKAHCALIIWFKPVCLFPFSVF